MLRSLRKPIDKAGLTTSFSYINAFLSVSLPVQIQKPFINYSTIKRMNIMLTSQDEC